MSMLVPSPPKLETSLRCVGLVFSGGPAPAGNAVICSAAGCFSRNGIKVLGFRRGYSRLLKYDGANHPLQEGTDYVVLDHKTLEGKRTSQGILLGTARENPGAAVKKAADLNKPEATRKLAIVYDALRSLDVDALVSIGGDDTLTTANKFRLFQQKEGKSPQIRVVHVPKTIDNDYAGIDFTFGYFSAADMLAREIGNLRADAEATESYHVVQVMGRQTGWLAYAAAIAGEASLVISIEDIPEERRMREPVIDPSTKKQMIDPDSGERVFRKVIEVGDLVERVVETMLARDAEGKHYGVVVLAEALGDCLPQRVLERCASGNTLVPDPYGNFPLSKVNFSPRFSKLIADRYKKVAKTRLQADHELERKVTGSQFGYEVRCHRPNAFDMLLASQLGVGAYLALVKNGEDGVMISVSGQFDLASVPFEELIDQEKLETRISQMSPDSDFHRLARFLETRVDGP